MLQQTKGIVLRSIKYGETSLVSTIFTAAYGVQTYLVQGIRTSTAKKASRAGLLQPASLLDLVVYYKPGKNLSRIREFSPAYLYRHVPESILKNSIALFSAELLLRLLPEDAAIPELFDFAFAYFQKLDELPGEAVANFPVYFTLQCSVILGYQPGGSYSGYTPYLSLTEGRFVEEPPATYSGISQEDTAALAALMDIRELEDLEAVEMNGDTRQRLLDWYLAYLRRHTDHMKPIKSLSVLGMVLRG